MVGDISVMFVIHGQHGNTIELTREEAERCLRALQHALKVTGEQSLAVIDPVTAPPKEKTRA